MFSSFFNLFSTENHAENNREHNTEHNPEMAQLVDTFSMAYDKKKIVFSDVNTMTLVEAHQAILDVGETDDDSKKINLGYTHFLHAMTKSIEYCVGVCEFWGKRDGQEDAVSGALLDAASAHFSLQQWLQLIIATCAEVEAMTKDLFDEAGKYQGSCFNGNIVIGDTIININSGDSESFLINVDEDIAQTKRINQLHNGYNSNEIARVKQAGGSISYGRVNGQLAVTRAFGDNQFNSKNEIVSHQPEIMTAQASKTGMDYLVIACDGLREGLIKLLSFDEIKERGRLLKEKILLAIAETDLDQTKWKECESEVIKSLQKKASHKQKSIDEILKKENTSIEKLVKMQLIADYLKENSLDLYNLAKNQLVDEMLAKVMHDFVKRGLTPGEMANELTEMSYKAGSADNISVVVIPVTQIANLTRLNPLFYFVADGHAGSAVSDLLFRRFIQTLKKNIATLLKKLGLQEQGFVDPAASVSNLATTTLTTTQVSLPVIEEEMMLYMEEHTQELLTNMGGIATDKSSLTKITFTDHGCLAFSFANNVDAQCFHYMLRMKDFASLGEIEEKDGLSIVVIGNADEVERYKQECELNAERLSELFNVRNQLLNKLDGYMDRCFESNYQLFYHPEKGAIAFKLKAEITNASLFESLQQIFTPGEIAQFNKIKADLNLAAEEEHQLDFFMNRVIRQSQQANSSSLLSNAERLKSTARM